MRAGSLLIAIVTTLMFISCKSSDTKIEVKRWRSPELVETLESGVKYYRGLVHFTDGPAMMVKVYEPVLNSVEKAPCVLIAPAGTTLITGNDLGDSHSPEHLPYAEEGIYVIAYELAGKVDDHENIVEYREGIRLFTLFNGGISNGKSAIDYGLKHFKQIDSQRLYSTGHSSAGTISLMLAANEPRLKGAIAYAPGTSIKAHFGLEALQLLIRYYGLNEDFDEKYSPLNNIEKLKCPIFLFQSKDDTITPYEEMEKFHKALTTHNQNVTLKVVDEGGHYYSMLYEGIPAGIEWILDDK